MKGYIPFTRGIPEGTYYKALKTEVEVVNGNVNDLLWDLAICRYVLQKIIDALWCLDKLPSKSQLHQLFYPMLRNYGLRAHVARNLYNIALALVKSARENKGSKPAAKKLFARLDYQDARVDLDKGIVKVILRDKWYTLKLKHRREYIERFRGLKWKEVHLTYREGKLYVSIVFEVRYRPYIPRGLLALDINLVHVVLYDGCSIKRVKTRFKDALSKRARAEELQKKYPSRWRYNPRILNRIRELHRRARNIITDSCWKNARVIVLEAKKRNYAIVIEDLTGLRESIVGHRATVRWKLEMFAYRRLQQAIITKAIEFNVPVILVDPRGTSSACPRCCNKLEYVYRLGYCRKCGFIADRDVIGAMNILFKALKADAGEPGSPQSGGGMKNETRQTAPIKG